MPTQVETDLQASTTVAKSLACCVRFAWVAGSFILTSSSVIATSMPRSAKRCRFAWRVVGTSPTMKWLWNPTQSMIPLCLRSFTTASRASDLLLIPSVLKSFYVRDVRRLWRRNYEPHLTMHSFALGSALRAVANAVRIYPGPSAVRKGESPRVPLSLKASLTEGETGH
jgi:hypothetical protein